MSSVPPPDELKAQLVFRLRANERPRPVAVRGREVVIGRDRTAGVCIPLATVSRQHARLIREGRVYWIEDMGSPAGLFVNGRLVLKAKLSHLDVISLGKGVDVVFTLRHAAVITKGTGIVRAALVPTTGGVEIEIPRGEMTVGRSSTVGVVLESAVVSRQHAVIQRTPHRIVVRDLGSANGTFVNGQRATISPLDHGDDLSFGNVAATSFRVAIEMGEVVTGTVQLEAVRVAGPGISPGKTMFNMDAGEIRALEDERARILARAAARKQDPILPQPAPSAKPAAAVPGAAAPPVVGGPAIPPITSVRLLAPGTDLVVTEPGSYDIGRSRKTALRVDHPTVSRKHARLVLRADRTSAFIEDAGGENGTSLNDRPVETPLALSDGDVVRIGELHLRVKLRRGDITGSKPRTRL